MRTLRIGARGFGHDAMVRLIGFGVRILTTGPFPDFPHSFSPQLSLDFGEMGDVVHKCETEKELNLGDGTIVFDAIIKARGGCTFEAESRFRPFFSGPLIVVHEDSAKPDSRYWVVAEELYGYCLLGQNPWLGSTRFPSIYTSSGRAEAYMYDGTLIADGTHERPHHLVYRRKDAPRLPRMVRN